MDRLMIEYLRKKGMGGMNEQEFMSRFKDFMTKYRRNSMRGGSMRHGGEGDFMPMDRMDNLYMKRHGGTEEFMDMFDSDDRLFDRFNRHGMEDDDMYKMFRFPTFRNFTGSTASLSDRLTLARISPNLGLLIHCWLPFSA